MEKTFGEKRIRTNFNPSQSTKIDQIKAKFAELIDELEKEMTSPQIISGEKARLIRIAQTKIEEAAMWAVKSLTE